MESKILENNFKYHDPNASQALRYMELRSAGLAVAEAINARCPESREKDLAIMKLEEAIMWANASIARNE